MRGGSAPAAEEAAFRNEFADALRTRPCSSRRSVEGSLKTPCPDCRESFRIDVLKLSRCPLHSEITGEYIRLYTVEVFLAFGDLTNAYIDDLYQVFRKLTGRLPNEKSGLNSLPTEESERISELATGSCSKSAACVDAFVRFSLVGVVSDFVLAS